MKPGMVFEGKGFEGKGFICVSKAEDYGGLEFYSQDPFNGAFIRLPLSEVRELAAYLQKHLEEITQSKN
jgi:hypothetical protein